MGHKCGLNGKFVSPKLQNPFTIRRGAAVVAVRRISHVAVVVHDNHAIGGRGRSTVGQADTHSLSRLFFKRSPLLACVRGMARRATEERTARRATKHGSFRIRSFVPNGGQCATAHVTLACAQFCPWFLVLKIG